MRKIRKLKIASLLFTGVTFSLACGAAAADALEGLVLAGGQPVANSTVTLWAASSGAPQQIGQARTDAEGRFTFGSTGAPGADASIYLIAKGGHSAGALVQRCLGRISRRSRR